MTPSPPFRRRTDADAWKALLQPTGLNPLDEHSTPAILAGLAPLAGRGCSTAATDASAIADLLRQASGAVERAGAKPIWTDVPEVGHRYEPTFVARRSEMDAAADAIRDARERYKDLGRELKDLEALVALATGLYGRSLDEALGQAT